MHLKTKPGNSQAFFPLLNCLGFLLPPAFPIQVSLLHARQLDAFAQQPLPSLSKHALPFHLRANPFDRSKLCAFGGTHRYSFQGGSANEPFSALFFRALQFDYLIDQAGTLITLVSLREKIGAAGLKAHWGRFPLSPVITLLPFSFLHHPLHRVHLSWQFPVLTYGHLRLEMGITTLCFKRLSSIFLAFSSGEGAAAAPIRSISALAYSANAVAADPAEVTPQRSHSSLPTRPLQGEGINSPSTLLPEQPLHATTHRGEGITTENENKHAEPGNRRFLDRKHDPTEAPPEIVSRDEKNAIEALIRSIQELCESRGFESLLENGLDYSSEGIWRALDGPHQARFSRYFDTPTLLHTLAMCGDENSWINLLHFAKVTETQGALWERLVAAGGRLEETFLYWLTLRDHKTRKLESLIDFAKETRTSRQLWQGLNKASGKENYPLLHWLALGAADTLWIKLIDFASSTNTQSQLWGGLMKAGGRNQPTPLYWLSRDQAKASWTSLIDLATNSNPEKLWEGLSEAINEFQTIPLYWFVQEGTQGAWTKLIRLAKENPQGKLWAVLELLVKMQIMGDISALLSQKHPVRTEGEAEQLTREMLLQPRESETTLPRENQRMAGELQRVTPRYDAFIEAILELPAMEASPILDALGFHFYFHHDRLNEGKIPYGALEILLRVALNPEAAHQIRDKILKIHSIHSQHDKTLKQTVPGEILDCAPIADWLFGNAGKQGKWWPTLIELLNEKLSQGGLERRGQTDNLSLYQSIATQRPHFEESLRWILEDQFNAVEGTSKSSEAQDASP